MVCFMTTIPLSWSEYGQSLPKLMMRGIVVIKPKQIVFSIKIVFFLYDIWQCLDLFLIVTAQVWEWFPGI